jgi:hypothetical protein
MTCKNVVSMLFIYSRLFLNVNNLVKVYLILWLTVEVTGVVCSFQKVGKLESQLPSVPSFCGPSLPTYKPGTNFSF